MMNAVLGHNDLGKFTATYLQIADILYPQIASHGAFTLIPVGIDQEPILRLAREVAKKMKKSHGFISPSSIYTVHLPSLLGVTRKMSKSEEGSALLLNSIPETIDQTISNAVTGGRDTLAQQVQFGGTPNTCPIYHVYRSNHPDTDFVAKVHANCKSGKLMCKEDKNVLKEILRTNIAAHVEKRAKFMDTARKIVMR